MPIVKFEYNLHRVRCLIWRFSIGNGRLTATRAVSQSSSSLSQTPAPPSRANNRDGQVDSDNGVEKERGAMYQRLADMTERSLEGRNANKTIEDAGLSEDLRRQLEERLRESTFRENNHAAFVKVDIPVSSNLLRRFYLLTIIKSSAGKGTRDTATARPWTGNETVEDAALRMLTDAHKPLRGTGPPRIPKPRVSTISVDLRMKKALQKSTGERLANARDRTSVYALSQDPNMTEKEREQMREQLKERFTAGARPMPASVQGLAALANERIEDAIARGQFKNIPRGKGTNIERDYTASSPFLDTTEYFMNKIIQKQEIVPPWIEKQQELVKAAAVFRSRLRADWKRHAARLIASKGGSLDSQVRRAEAYAAAETTNNPKLPNVEKMSEVDNDGKLAQITVSETPSLVQEDDTTVITVTQSTADDQPSPPQPSPTSNNDQIKPPTTHVVPPSQPLVPFRDPNWEATERAYHTLAITSLNSLTRSYNLMAPDLAKKPYFSLSRELRSCFADVAILLPEEIKARARAPAKIKIEVVGHRPGGVLERFAGEKAKVYDDQRPEYGFKQFWKDLWGRGKVRG